MDAAVELWLSPGLSCRPLLNNHLTPEDLLKAEKELNETNESRVRGLQELRSLIEGEKNLLCRADDDYLIRFLRPRKFNTQRALQLLQNYYRFRADHKSTFKSPSSLEALLRERIIEYLPHRDQFGRAILLSKFHRWNPKTMKFTDCVAAGRLMLEWGVDNHVTQVNGYVGIMDCSGFSLDMFYVFCNLTNTRMLILLLQDCFPGRFKTLYLVNCHKLLKAAWTIVRPLIKDKFKRRVMLFGTDLSPLHRHLPPCILPQEYGGQVPPTDYNDGVEKVLQMEALFMEDANFGYPN